jgi:transposase
MWSSGRFRRRSKRCFRPRGMATTRTFRLHCMLRRHLAAHTEGGARHDDELSHHQVVPVSRTPHPDRRRSPPYLPRSPRIWRTSADRWSGWCKLTQLAAGFDCNAQTISNRVAHAASDTGKPACGKDVQNSAEREKQARLQREVRWLKMERDILAKATAWFAADGDKASIGSTNS